MELVRPGRSARGGTSGARKIVLCRLAPKPHEFIGFGVMEVAKPYKCIGFGVMEVTKPYQSIGFGVMEVTKPYKCIGFGVMEVTRPYKMKGCCAEWRRNPMNL